jgi:4-amino-4-deoxy-L-arabinose transferase-like glycosyltransferase
MPMISKTNPPRNRWKKYEEHIFVACLMLVVLCMGFIGLGNNHYWDDEAETAVFAKNYLARGQFTGWDGRNLYTYRNGAVLDKNLNSINPPLGYYIAAAGFKMFGVNNAAGRALFVLFGVAALMVFWLLLREEFPDDLPLRIYALVLTGLSSSFILNIRQCRYYALCLFGGVAVYYFYLRAVRESSFSRCLLLASAFVFLFYSNYLLCTAFLFAMVLVHLIFYARKLTYHSHIRMGMSMLVFALAGIPYALYYRIWERHDTEIANSHLVDKLILLYQNVRELDTTGYLPGIIILAGMVMMIFLRKKMSFPTAICKWVVIVSGYTIALSALSLQPAIWSGWGGGLADVRYLVTLLPFCAGMVGVVLYGFHGLRHGVYISILLLIFLLISNIFSFAAVSGGTRLWLPHLIREISHDDETSYDAIVGFMRDRTDRDDIVYAYPEYTLNVLQFYLGDHLRIQGCIRDPFPFQKDALDKVNGLKYIDESIPHWIVLFGVTPGVKEMLEYFSRESYVYRPYAVLPVFAVDMTRPELPLHHFGPVTDFDMEKQGIYILRREAGSDPPP